MPPSWRGPGAVNIPGSGGEKPTTAEERTSSRGPGVIRIPGSRCEEHVELTDLTHVPVFARTRRGTHTWFWWWRTYSGSNATVFMGTGSDLFTQFLLPRVFGGINPTESSRGLGARCMGGSCGEAYKVAAMRPSLRGSGVVCIRYACWCSTCAFYFPTLSLTFRRFRIRIPAQLGARQCLELQCADHLISNRLGTDVIHYANNCFTCHPLHLGAR